MIGLLMAFLLEYLDVGFRTRRQIEEATGMETVASLPELKDAKEAGRDDVARLLKANPSFVEAIRYARVSLCLTPDPARAARGILVTSALPGEGKSFVSVALGLSFAGGGQRTITVDCDLRRNNPADGPGLAQILLGTATLEACLREDKVTGLHHLPAGQVDGLIDPPQLLASPRMRALYEQLTTRFDIVLLDTPPVKLFPDALIVQQLVDKVFFLVRWAKTRREVSIDALKTIVQCGHYAPVVGLTLVDFRQLPRFDYAARVPKQIRPLMRM
jgi:capsular exopolysaccharide synthesis family protein